MITAVVFAAVVGAVSARRLLYGPQDRQPIDLVVVAVVAVVLGIGVWIVGVR